MPDTPPDPSKVDPERHRDGQPFNATDGRDGQTYRRDRETELGERAPGGTVAARPGEPAAADLGMPPDNGRRAAFDPVTGEVHGSGSGAGGGNPGEDFDSDAATGDGYPITGGEGRPKGAERNPGHRHPRE